MDEQEVIDFLEAAIRAIGPEDTPEHVSFVASELDIEIVSDPPAMLITMEDGSVFKITAQQVK